MLPLNTLVKSAGFPVSVLPPTQYISMVAELATLPKGFAGRLKAPQNVVLLTYGAKKGGVVRVYETPVVQGITPDAFAYEIAKAGVFRDINRQPGWFVKGKTVGKVFVTPTGNNVALVKEALGLLGQ